MNDAMMPTMGWTKKHQSVTSSVIADIEICQRRKWMRRSGLSSTVSDASGGGMTWDMTGSLFTCSTSYPERGPVGSSLLVARNRLLGETEFWSGIERLDRDWRAR